MAHQVSLGAQLLEGERDGVARDAQVIGEGPGGGQPFARGQAPREDGGAQPVVDLAVQWRRRAAVERHQHLGGVGDAAARAFWTSHLR